LNADVITVRGLRKNYGGQVVVDGIDLGVGRGECFGLLGPNGAGKSTTLRMLLGITPADAGEVDVLGYRVPEQARQMRTRVGVVPQKDNLDPDFTVTENLSIYASYFDLRGAPVAARIRELLAFVALEEKAQASVPTLSGGMQRRLTLARALVNTPDLLILDEPSTGLDPQARHVIWQRLRTLKSEGKTLVLTTHYMDEAERLCDRLAIMDRGRILVTGKPRELIAQLIEPHVVEVHGTDLDRWVEDVATQHARRVEQVGETAFCYCDEDRALLESSARYPQLQFLSRRANLEDVFLKLTGRDLRD
jgi:lipooligosaccharide transport system ATP-binding protein